MEGFEHIERAIADIAAGKAVVVVDDEDRRDPVKVRADYHDDAEMSWLSAAYASPTHEDVPELVRKTGKRQEKAS